MFKKFSEKKDLTFELKQAFIIHDLEGKGSIPTSEVCRIIKNLGQVSLTVLLFIGCSYMLGNVHDTGLPVLSSSSRFTSSLIN